MPPVIPAVILAAKFLVSKAVVTFIAKVAVFALISKALQPKAKRPDAGAEVSQDRSVVVRSTTEPHRIIYGRAIVSGLLVYFETTGSNKEYAHLVIVMAAHEVDAIQRLWFDDVEVGALDGSGNVTTGRYANVARVKKFLGTAAQTADTDLVAESAGGWTTNDRLRGRAGVYLRLKRDDTAYPNGLPNVRAEVRGRKVYDPRDAATRWTMNPALIQRDILTSAWGLGASSGEIDDTLVQSAANVDDERVAVTSYTSGALTADNTTDRLTFAVGEIRFGIGDGVTIASSGTLPSGLAAATTYYFIRISETVFQLASTYANALAGTAINFTTNGSGTITLSHVDQVRYTCNGTFTRNTDPKEMLEAVALCHVGPAPIFREGQWRIYAGAWSTPSVTITESDLRGDVTEQVRPPRQQLFNAVRGTYAPAFNAVSADYTPITNSTYETQDGSVQIFKDLPQPLQDNTVRAQRIAKLVLEMARAGSTLVLPCKLTALGKKIATWDTIYVTLSVFGLSAATYRVRGWQLVAEENGSLGVDLTVTAEDSALYGWTASSATSPSSPPDLVLPNPSVIAAPTSLVMSSGTTELLRLADGTIISRVKVSFTGAVEPNLWRYELQWKKSTESTYNTVYMPSDSTVYYLAPVEDGVNYNIQVRTHAVLGPRSAWLTGTHTVIGKTAAPTAPTSLGLTPATGGFDLEWSACPDADYFATQVYEASSNDRSLATQIAEVNATRMARTGLLGGVARYYWVRHVDTTGNVSTFYPVSATGGVSGTTGSAGNTQQITHDTTSYLAGGASGYLSGAGYWLGYSTGYKMHLGDPAGAYMAWDASALTVKGSIFTGDITVNTTGNIRGGQTAYDTGTGFWIGYDAGAYKFSFGNASGSKITWNGTTLTINGTVAALVMATGGSIRQGQTAYNTGTGFWLGDSSGAKLSIGNPSGNYITWDGSTLTINGSVVDARPYAAGSNAIAGSSSTLYPASGTMTKMFSIQVARSGTLTVDFTIGGGVLGGTTNGRIYRNGSAVGTSRSVTGTGTSNFSENIGSISAGDTIELWGSFSGSGAGYLTAFTLKNSFRIGEFVALQ